MTFSTKVLGVCVTIVIVLIPWMESSAAALKKGPYLLYAGKNAEMHVLWQTDGTSVDSIRWGKDSGYSAGRAASMEYGTRHFHNYTIADLAPGEKVFYEVEAGTAKYDGSFRAAPDSNADRVKFLAYGDTRRGGDTNTSGPRIHDRVARLIDSTFASDEDYQTMILESGDLVVNGDSDDIWQRDFFDARWSNIHAMTSSLPYQASMGNHEKHGRIFQEYFPYPFVSDRYWSFDYGPAHIVVIDQFDSGYTDHDAERINWLKPEYPQYRWLENDLKSSSKPWKILLFHEPGWSADGEPLKKGEHRRKGKGHTNNADVQTYIEPLCEKYGVHLVIGGHNHFYARAKIMTSSGDSVFHVTAGGGGAPLYDSVSPSPNIVAFKKTNNFCKINIVSSTLMEIEAVSIDGEVIDKFSINRGN